VEFKMDKTANVSIVVGKRSFAKDNLLANAAEAVQVLVKSKPEVFKGRFIKSMTLSSTMSPGVRVSGAEYASTVG